MQQQPLSGPAPEDAGATTVGRYRFQYCCAGARLLGVHAIGTGATELIHIGQAVMAAGMPIDYFVDSVFNYPTLAECYKVAALDGINRVRTAGDRVVPIVVADAQPKAA